MEIRPRFILTTCIVNILLTFVPVLNEVVLGSIHDAGNVQKNIENLFDSVARNNLQRGETIRDLLKHDVDKEQEAFDTMKEEFRITRHRNADEKKSEDVNVMVKRETENNNYDSGVHGDITNAHGENGIPHSRASDGPSLHSSPYPNWDSTVKSTYYPQRPRSYQRPDNRPSHYRNEYDANGPSRQYDRPYGAFNSNYTTSYYGAYNPFVPSDQQFYYGSSYNYQNYDPHYGQPHYDYTPQQYYYSQPAVNPNYHEQYNDPRYGQQQNYPPQQYNQQYPQQGNRDFRQTPSKSDQLQFTVRAHSSIADVPLSTQQNNSYSRRKKSKSMNAKTTPTAKPISSTGIVNATETTSAVTETTSAVTETTAAPTETMPTATTPAPTATTTVATARTVRTTTTVKTTRLASTATTGRTATSKKIARTTSIPSASSVWTVYVSRRRQQGMPYPQRQHQEPGERQQAGRQYYPQPRQQQCHQANRGSSTTLKPQEEEKKSRFSRLCKYVKGIFRKITFCKDEDEDEDQEEPKQPEQEKSPQSYDRIDQRTSSYRPYRNNQDGNFNHEPNYRPYRSRFQERNPDTNYFGPSSAGYHRRSSYAIKYEDKGEPKQPQHDNNPQSYDRIDQRTTSYRPYRNFYQNRNFNYDPNYRPYQNGPDRYQQRSPDTNFFSPSSTGYYYRDAINQRGNFDDQKNYNRRFNYKPIHYDYNHPHNLENEPQTGDRENYYGPDANNANGDHLNPETSPRLS